MFPARSPAPLPPIKRWAAHSRVPTTNCFPSRCEDGLSVASPECPRRAVLGGWRRCGTKGWRWFGVGALRSRFWHLAMSSLSTTGLSSM